MGEEGKAWKLIAKQKDHTLRHRLRKTDCSYHFLDKNLISSHFIVPTETFFTLIFPIGMFKKLPRPKLSIEDRDFQTSIFLRNNFFGQKLKYLGNKGKRKNSRTDVIKYFSVTFN
jgi:hypothetical protein